MIRILLACEGGSGLGHVDSLAMIARALGPAFAFDGVHYSDDALKVLDEVCDETFKGPAFLPSAARAEARASLEGWSWANFLERCGLGNVQALAPSLNWWRLTLLQREIDLVVCDYAPRALIAARMLGIPVVLTGTAYSVPPNGLERFPAFLDRSQPCSVDEAAMTRKLNAFCGIRGLPELQVLPDIFDCEVKLPQGLSFLDPYDELRTEQLLPRPSNFSKILAGDGNEIFVYLSNIGADPDFMLDALDGLGAPVRLFVPWLDTGKASRLSERGIAVENKPQHPDDLARRTRLMVLYGQPGTTALGLASGIPQVAFPQHIEQLVHAERAARHGGVSVVRREGLDRDGFVNAIRVAYADEGLQAAARRGVDAVRREMDIDIRTMIQEALRPTLLGIIKRKGLA
jgi:hypothetical protein